MRCNAVSSRARLFAALLSVPLGAGAEPPAPYPIGREIPAFEASADPRENAAPSAPEPDGVLLLRDALAAALLRSPDLAADAQEVRVREADLLQARALPNPTLAIELEDVGGTGEYEGFDGAQTTLRIGQLIELGGKRARRVALADADRDLAAWDYEVRRIDVLTRTAGAFVDVLAAQERMRLAEESLGLARAVRRVAQRRLHAGLANPAEEIRAGVAVDIAEVELEHGEHELATARQALAAQWGGETPRFERAEGALDRLPPTPRAADLEQRLAASPAVARWRAETARRRAAQESARSEQVPDLTLHAGPRHLSGPDDTVLVVGVSVPLPLFDRRRGALAAAEHRIAQATSEARATRVRAAADLAAACIALEAASEEAALLRSRVIPGTERAVEAMRRGYEQGRFAQLEVLDAERARLAAREQYVGVLSEAHHSAQRIERLTGVPLEEMP